MDNLCRIFHNRHSEIDDCKFLKPDVDSEGCVHICQECFNFCEPFSVEKDVSPDGVAWRCTNTECNFGKPVSKWVITGTVTI